MRDERYDMNNKRPNVFISEERARMLNKIDPRLIQPNGRYPGYINGQPVGILKYEEIMYLRKKYNDPTIAEGYEFNGVKAFQAENLKTRKSTAPIQNPRQPRTPNEIQRREAANAQQTRQSSSRSVPNTVQRSPKRRKHKKYALQRTRRFVGYAIRAIEKDGKKILVRIGSTVLAVVVAASLWSGFKNKGTDITLGPESTITIENSNVAGTQEELIATNPEEDIMEVRRSTIEKYAYIYQLDFNTAWYFMEWITNNFQDSGYLNEYTLENISCKGSGQLYCNSEEELISYTMRVLKQEPGRFGLTKEQLARKTNDYVRPTTMEEYKKIIFDTCKVHGVDPALIYAIVRQETGFNSDYFMQYNNPGGIYFDGKNIVKFDTLEEGILELIHEVEKYLRLEGIDPDNINLPVEDLIIIIGNKHCPENDEKDTQGLNKHWKPNVAEFYYEAMPEFERMEIEYQANQAVESTRIRH